MLLKGLKLLKIAVIVLVLTEIKEQLSNMKNFSAHFVYQFPPILYY